MILILIWELKSITLFQIICFCDNRMKSLNSYFYVYTKRQWADCDGLETRVRVILSHFISSNSFFLFSSFLESFFKISLQQVCFCFDVDFCYLLSLCFVQLLSSPFYIFISSQQRAMNKVCILFEHLLLLHS